MSRYHEPWRVDEHAQTDRCHQICANIDGNEATIAFMSTGWENGFDLANAERIVACVNACADIENPAALKEAIVMFRGIYMMAELAAQIGKNQTWAKLAHSISEAVEKLDRKQ